MAQWLQARVVANHAWTDRLYSLQFEAELPSFKPGQFIRVGLDVEGERIGRPYSLVNAPGQSPAEIYYNPVPEGPLSPRLAKLQPGDVFWVSDSANGFLTLDEVPDCRHLWLLATGTGVGPFVAMLADDSAWQRFDQVMLVHSVRSVAELGYRDRFESLAAKHPGHFHYLPTVTRESQPGMLSQRIPVLIAEGGLEEAVGMAITPEDAHVMLCGSNEMITDTIAVLGERGLQRHRRREPGHISMEKYH